jgi:hypothetical protein
MMHPRARNPNDGNLPGNSSVFSLRDEGLLTSSLFSGVPHEVKKAIAPIRNMSLHPSVSDLASATVIKSRIAVFFTNRCQASVSFVKIGLLPVIIYLTGHLKFYQ